MREIPFFRVCMYTSYFVSAAFSSELAEHIDYETPFARARALALWRPTGRPAGRFVALMG